MPSVTPFGDDGSIDVDALIAHCDWLLSSGASGLMLFGTTGEGSSLSVAEKVTTAKAVVAAFPDVAVIASVMENALPDIADAVRAFNELPLAATLVLPPSYLRESQSDGLRELFELILEVCEHPLIAYHIPGLAPAVAASIVVDLPMWGAKDSGGDITYTDAVLAGGKPVMVGAEPLLLASMQHGASGGICGVGNVAPALIAEVCRAARDGRIDDAQRALDVVVRLQRAVIDAAPDMEWIAAFKAIAGSLHGTDLGSVRLPLKSRRNYLTPEVLAALEEAANLGMAEES
ncbi:MAG TPA: dihydrodipicolinate synthase family protein [Acidothermaceae bacterium]